MRVLHYDPNLRNTNGLIQLSWEEWRTDYGAS